MNKTELVAAVARNTGNTKTATAAIVNETIRVIVAAVAAGRHVQLSDFGRFEARDRRERTARNLGTGEPLRVPATRVPAFRAGKAFRNAVKPG